MLAIDLLEQQGALRRLPGEAGAGQPTVRYQPRDRHDIITLQMPGPRQHDGVTIQPRGALPTQAPARLDQVRRLIRLDDPLIFSDPRTGTTRAGLHQQLEQAGRELLGSAHVAYFGKDEADERQDDRPLDPALVADVLEHHGMLFYCPNVEKSASLSAAARGLGAHSAVFVAVTDSDGRPIGHLEVRNAEPEPYLPADLAMIALLADYCGGVLERATRIEKLVFVDPHTGVYNRSYYDLQIRNEIARATREHSSLALLICDIDDFKSFNTSFGFEAGNQVLVQVAQTLRAGVRPFDTVARWGGEEFAVLLTPPVGQEDVVAISERLRASVERTPMRLEGLDGRAHRVHVTVSVGVAMFPDHADDAAGPVARRERRAAARQAPAQEPGRLPPPQGRGEAQPALRRAPAGVSPPPSPPSRGSRSPARATSRRPIPRRRGAGTRPPARSGPRAGPHAARPTTPRAPRRGA